MRFLVYCVRFFILTGRGNDFWKSYTSGNVCNMKPNLETLTKHFPKCHSKHSSSKVINLNFNSNSTCWQIWNLLSFHAGKCRDDAFAFRQAPLPLLSSLNVSWLLIRNISEDYPNNKDSWKRLETHQIQMRHAQAWNLSKSAFHSVIPKPHYFHTQHMRWLMQSGISILLFSGWMKKWSNTEKIH